MWMKDHSLIVDLDDIEIIGRIRIGYWEMESDFSYRSANRREEGTGSWFRSNWVCPSHLKLSIPTFVGIQTSTPHSCSPWYKSSSVEWWIKRVLPLFHYYILSRYSATTPSPFLSLKLSHLSVPTLHKPSNIQRMNPAPLTTFEDLWYSRIIIWGGGIFAPAVTGWFGALQRIPIQSKWPAALAKTGLDQFAFAPIAISGMSIHPVSFAVLSLSMYDG